MRRAVVDPEGDVIESLRLHLVDVIDTRPGAETAG